MANGKTIKIDINTIKELNTRILNVKIRNEPLISFMKFIEVLCNKYKIEETDFTVIQLYLTTIDNEILYQKSNKGWDD